MVNILLFFLIPTCFPLIYLGNKSRQAFLQGQTQLFYFSHLAIPDIQFYFYFLKSLILLLKKQNSIAHQPHIKRAVQQN